MMNSAQATSATKLELCSFVKRSDSTTRGCKECRNFATRLVGAVELGKIGEIANKAYPEIGCNVLDELSSGWRLVNIHVPNGRVVFHHCSQGSFVHENLENFKLYNVCEDTKNILEICASLDKDLLTSIFKRLMNDKEILLVCPVKTERAIAKEVDVVEYRRKTFYNQNGMLKCANFKDGLSPERMAKAGFEYVGEFRESCPEDTVYCESGAHYVGEFLEGEDSLIEHIRLGAREKCPWVDQYLSKVRIVGEKADCYDVYVAFLTDDFFACVLSGKDSIAELSRDQIKEIAGFAISCLFEKSVKALEFSILSSCLLDTTVNDRCREIVKNYSIGSGLIVDFLIKRSFDENTLKEFGELRKGMISRLEAHVYEGSSTINACRLAVVNQFK